MAFQHACLPQSFYLPVLDSGSRACNKLQTLQMENASYWQQFRQEKVPKEEKVKGERGRSKDVYKSLTFHVVSFSVLDVNHSRLSLNLNITQTLWPHSPTTQSVVFAPSTSYRSPTHTYTHTHGAHHDLNGKKNKVYNSNNNKKEDWRTADDAVGRSGLTVRGKHCHGVEPSEWLFSSDSPLAFWQFTKLNTQNDPVGHSAC